MTVYQVLYEILLNNKISTTSKQLLKKEYFTDHLYKLASENHLLPALYNAIKKNNFDSYFPSEFINATAYFQSLNQSRNQDLLKQINAITKLFNDNNIDYCFLKGAALLILNPYQELSTRMIGDIDMLVNPKQLETANSLLIKNNYKPFETSPDPVYKNHRHLPRLVNDNFIAAVELHSHLLEKPQKQLKPFDVLSDKQNLNDSYIPTINHLCLHSIFNFQINDEAYHTWNFSFKSLYDCLSLTKGNKIIPHHLELNNKYICRYWLSASLFINDIDMKPNLTEKLKISFISFIYKHPFLLNIFLKIVFIWNRKHTFPKRIWAFITDKNYRDYLLKKS